MAGTVWTPSTISTAAPLSPSRALPPLPKPAYPLARLYAPDIERLAEVKLTPQTLNLFAQEHRDNQIVFAWCLAFPSRAQFLFISSSTGSHSRCTSSIAFAAATYSMCSTPPGRISSPTGVCANSELTMCASRMRLMR